MTDEIIQGTDAWKALRAGKVTASRIADVIAKIKTGEAAGRANYRADLIAERLTGIPAESYFNAAMEWGINTEPLARLAYEAVTGNQVQEVAFVPHPNIEWSGASPDGLVGDDGLVEIKCPNTSTHLTYLLQGKVPAKYIPQMAWQLACTGREWCDFVSFDPRLPERNQLFIVRYERDDAYIAEFEEEVRIFLAEVQEIITKLEKM